MLKGIPVVLMVKKEVGRDEFKHPIYEEKPETIENVLVAPANSTDIINTQDLEGKKAVYTLAIPKGDTHDWKDCKVEFFGQIWKVFGYPLEGIEENIPLDWNKKVTVELYE